MFCFAVFYRYAIYINVFNSNPIIIAIVKGF